MTSKREDREALIEEAAKAILTASHGEDYGDWEGPLERELYVKRARAALAVFEQAHTPTENSGPIPLYGMLDVWMALYGTSHPEFDEFYAEHGYAETWARILAAVRERRPVQGEPTDAQVRAARETLAHSAGYVPDQVVRAALRAAAAVTEQGGENRG